MPRRSTSGLRPLTQDELRRLSPSELVAHVLALKEELKVHTSYVDWFGLYTSRRETASLDGQDLPPVGRTEGDRLQARRELEDDCDGIVRAIEHLDAQPDRRAYARLVAEIELAGSAIWHECYVQLELDYVLLRAQYQDPARGGLASHLSESVNGQLRQIAQGAPRVAPVVLGHEEHTFKRLGDLRAQLEQLRQELAARTVDDPPMSPPMSPNSLANACVGEGHARISKRTASRYEL